MSLPKFLEEKIEYFERIVPKVFSPELLEEMKNDMAYGLKMIALLKFRDMEKEIISYLISRNYNPILGEQKQNERRLLRKTQYEQNPETN